MPSPVTLRPDQARRLALGAQGFGRPREAVTVDVRHLRRTLRINSVVQLDSVNVLARAHYLPFWSRLGPYDRDRLDDWLWSSENLEFWAHVASVTPVELLPLLRFRIRDAEPWSKVRELLAERPGYIDEVYAAVVERGPISVSDLDEPGGRSGSWWGWNVGRVALDWLFSTGRIVVAFRDPQFTLHFDLPERVIPAEVLSQPDVPDAVAFRELVRLAVRAHGVGTAADLADHFRLRTGDARAALSELVAAGEVQEVTVEGWDVPAYVDADASIPRRIEAASLLSPFDPVVWFRPRAERVFGFFYRIEIYVPAAKRVHGYYVLPFLLGDRLVARVDLKADRAEGRLLVLGAFAESHADVATTSGALAEELRGLADWLELTDVTVADNGDLASSLRRLV